MTALNTLLPAIESWRGDTVSAVCARFAQMLDKAVPMLMDQAEKARSNDVQGAYFQAQLELRRHADKVRQQFAETLSRRMAEPPAAAPTQGGDDRDELQLVNPDIFDRQVALQTLADRSEQRYLELLHELGHRLSAIRRGTPVRYADIPASPRQLLEALDAALQTMTLERIARQALAVLFDHAVLRHMTPHYAALNDLLRNAGVLPNLQFQIVRHPKGEKTPGGRPKTDKPRHDAGTAPAPGTRKAGRDSVVDQIRALMPGGDPSRDATALPAAEVAHLIHARHEALAGLLPDHGVFAPAAGPLRISARQLRATQQAMQQQRQTIKREIGPERLSRYDESTIDIVGALFEAMLDEADLPAPIKALLGHLHTPYLKLALREPELLSDRDHPARLLLNELVDAGEAWGHASNPAKGVFPVLQEIVEALHHVDAPQRAEIEQQRSVLAGKIDELRQLRDMRGSRTTEAEVGREKLAHARTLAETQVYRLIKEGTPCQPCQDFLTGPWVDYLTLQLLRNDGQPGGEHWQTGLALGEEIASLSRAVRAAEPPSRDALGQLREHLIAELGDLAPSYRSKIEELMQGMMKLRDQDRSTIEPLPPAPAPPRPKPTQEAEQQAPLSAAEARLADELAATPAGTLFRLPGKDGGEPRVVTLTWFNPQTQRLLFVDQTGVKSDLITAPTLARLIHKGEAERIADDRPPFISRALSTLRQYLEKSGLIKQGNAND